jgi:hypothetical protein
LRRTAAVRDSDDETLAWLDFSLRWAGAKDRPKLVRLLELVKSEVVFEIKLAEEAESPGSLKRAETG